MTDIAKLNQTLAKILTVENPPWPPLSHLEIVIPGDGGRGVIFVSVAEENSELSPEQAVPLEHMILDSLRMGGFSDPIMFRYQTESERKSAEAQAPENDEVLSALTDIAEGLSDVCESIELCNIAVCKCGWSGPFWRMKNSRCPMCTSEPVSAWELKAAQEAAANNTM